MKEISNRRAFLSPSGLAPDDRILPETRWLAALIIPFLVVAFIILYFWPHDTDKLFAWTIKPTITPMMLAAAYVGGIYFFTRAILAKQWHQVKLGFLPVTALHASRYWKKTCVPAESVRSHAALRQTRHSHQDGSYSPPS